MLILFLNSFGFQNPNRLSILKLVLYHDKIIRLILLIRILVRGRLFIVLMNKISSIEYLENQIIEFLWTIIPAIILIFIAFPSIKALYYTDEFINSHLTVKIIGHQWYWSYSYPILKNINTDSFLNPLRELKIGEIRLLEVRNRIFTFNKIVTRFIVTSLDVIHSWTIPVLGIKIDAIPGRIRLSSAMPIFRGVFYGQCSEICGVNHSFIPIKIEILSSSFLKFFF